MPNTQKLLFFCCLCTIVSSVTIGGTIGYQVHSWNDIREWKQGFVKGMLWMKIDANFQEDPFCKSQNRVANDTRGCLVLTHDTPVTTRTDYNTTEDVLSFVSDPSNLEIFQRESQVVIALCFKNPYDPCDGSISSQNWMSLVDDFFAKANSLIETLQLNLQFILDGAATPNSYRLCLKDKWRPWIATWILFKDPFGALFEDDVEHAWDRFQVMNPAVIPFYPSLNLQFLAYYNYGKFIENYNLPFLTWEPSDQLSILSVASTYVNKRLIQPAGFKFSINIDPVQLEVYAAPLSQQAWNEHLPLTLNHTKPLVTSMVTSSGITFLVLSQKKNCSVDCSIETIYKTNGSFEQVSQVSTKPLLVSHLSSPTSISSVAISTDASLVLISDTSSRYAFFFLDNEVLKFHSNGTLQKGSKSFGTSFTEVPMGRDDGVPMGRVIGEIFASPECSLTFIVHSVSNTSRTFPIGKGVCLLKTASPSLNASVSLTFDASPSSSCNGIIGVVSYSLDNEIFSSLVCLSHSQEYSFLSPQPPHPIGVGSNPQISTVLFNQVPYILQVQGDSFCWNSHLQNIQAAPAICDLTPSSTPFVLSYSFSSLTGWLKALKERKLFSSCSDYLVHGMYDMGSWPSIDLFVTKEKEGPQLRMVELHEGINDRVQDKGGCGLPVVYPGLVLDGWKLPKLPRSSFVL